MNGRHNDNCNCNNGRVRPEPNFQNVQQPNRQEPLQQGRLNQQPVPPIQMLQMPVPPAQLPPQYVQPQYQQPQPVQQPLDEGRIIRLIQEHAQGAGEVRLRQSSPYPEWIHQVQTFPPGYRPIQFYRFSGEDDSVSTHEHIVRFKGGCGETSENPFLLLRQFPMSLTGGGL